MKKIASTLIAFVSFFLTSCSLPSANELESTKSANKTVPITVAYFSHFFLYIPLYVAKDRGFFNDEGLDVKFVSTGGDEKAFTAVSAGNAQFAVSDPVFAAIARERGQGGKVVAGVVSGIPFWLVTYKKEIKPAVTAADLKGLRIASLPAPSTCYAVTEELLQNNGHPVKARIIQGAAGTLEPMLRSDQADAAMEIEPIVSTAVAHGAHVIYAPAEKGSEFAFTGMTVSDQFYADHPEIIQHAVNAMTKAMNYIQSNFDGTVEVAQKEYPETDKSIIVAALKRMIGSGTTPKNPLVPKIAWDNAISMRKKLGDIKEKGSFEENVDMSFVKRAMAK